MTLQKATEIMKTDQEKCTSTGNYSLFNSPHLVWLLLSIWLVYNAVMLWHFKEQTNWNAAVCSAPR